MPDFAAVVLAGGAARRMGGTAKPVLPVGGVPLLQRVLTAVGGADPVIVVGPPSLSPLVPPPGRVVQEEPLGGGPVIAAHAGVRLLTRTGIVVLLAADLPFLTADVVARLVAEVNDDDGAVLVDATGRPQWLCGAWRIERLATRLAGAAPGASLRSTLGDLRLRLTSVDSQVAPPWFDCDTPTDLEQAEEWTHADPR
jgi:molybdopterin-guanine dinucleotide biosynthesis protein A